MTIHPTAIVEDGARLAGNVTIGPYCTVGPHVILAEGVELVSQVAVAGHTHVGAGTRIWPFASIGHQPQDLKYRGEETELIIGDDNTIREFVTINTGTAALLPRPNCAIDLPASALSIMTLNAAPRSINACTCSNLFGARPTA